MTRPAPPPGSPGDRLRRLVASIPEDRRPSLREIARRSGVSAAAVSKILSGRNPNPGILTVGRILDAIGSTLRAYEDSKPPRRRTRLDRALPMVNNGG